MRVAAIATLTLGLVLAALWLALGAPAPALAVGPSQAIDIVTIRMVRNNQPESVFPRGTKQVDGVVTYNLRDDAGNPIGGRRTTVSIVDSVGLEVYTKTFTTQGSYTGSATETFSVTGDQMMKVYTTTATVQAQKAATDASAITPATDRVTNTMLTSVSAVQYAASQAQGAADRMRAFIEISPTTRDLLTQAYEDLKTAVGSADAIVTAGACTPAPGQDCTSKVTGFNQNLQTVQQKTQSAQATLAQAVAQIAGLSNLSVPLTNECTTNPQTGQKVPQAYTSNVLQVLPPGTSPTRRDQWEWQVGDQSATPTNAILTASPSRIYTLDVAVAPTHTSQIRATVLDVQCLPVLDGVNVTFGVTGVGQVSPTSVTTTSSGGLHGLASTTLQATNQSGNATVQLSGLAGAGASVTIVGKAAQISFLTGSGQPSLVVQRGADTEIQVRVVDAPLANPVADGTLVQFSVTSGAGTFSPNPAPTVNGIARTTFSAGMSGTAATITAQVPGTPATANLQVTFVGDPATITLGVKDTFSTTLYLNSVAAPKWPYTYIEATVKDDQGNPVADGTPVEFRLLAEGKAVWDQPSPSDAKITQVNTMGGKATAKLTAVPGGANSTVGVVAGVPGTSVQIPPFQALEITIVAPKSYDIYLPAIFKTVQCGKQNPGGGCAARPPIQ